MSESPKKPSQAEGETPAAAGAVAGERIAKVMAHAGLCSRRDAERWIADGRVKINGTLIESPAVNVGADDIVTVDGTPLPARERTRLWRYHKPKGLVTTHKDPEGRPTVFAAIPADLPRVVSIGRLDLGSEGLLLLTNDGGLARRMELPSSGWQRRYRVRVHGEVDPARLVALERVQGSNAWLMVGLQEGKNREIRRVMEHLGWSVTRLIRIAYGPFQLGHLPVGEVEEVPGKVLREQLGSGSGTGPTRLGPTRSPTRKGGRTAG
ncbi:MAG: rRNA pseudouridine synthase [Alphaproteobacteria bacterium]|nr:rRNA pseudouridine synthase [Alphaproteobacteria bacterium]